MSNFSNIYWGGLPYQQAHPLFNGINVFLWSGYQALPLVFSAGKRAPTPSGCVCCPGPTREDRWVGREFSDVPTQQKSVLPGDLCDLHLTVSSVLFVASDYSSLCTFLEKLVLVLECVPKAVIGLFKSEPRGYFEKRKWPAFPRKVSMITMNRSCLMSRILLSIQPLCQ